LLGLNDLIGQSQHLGVQFMEFSPGFLRVPPGPGQLADASPLVGRDAVELVFARLTASQDISGMQLAFGAAAGGLTAFAVQEVKASRDEFCGLGHLAQKGAGGAEVAPELAAEVAGRGGHLCSTYIYYIQVASKKVSVFEKR
jgi:hypothetical protein